MPDPEPRTPDAVRADMQRCAGAIETTEAALKQHYERRNRLFAEGDDVGVTPTETAVIFGVKAQTVRWNLKKRDRPDAPTSNTIPRRRHPSPVS